MFDAGVPGEVHVGRPVFLEAQLTDVAHGVGDHVVEHQRVEAGEPALGHEQAVACREDQQLEPGME